ncbi:MAG TPA: TolC family protein [Anaeromyxobacteraceae bacterium]|nr:TolC family protein [Anaeromyxobacteraceae bacterium]
MRTRDQLTPAIAAATVAALVAAGPARAAPALSIADALRAAWTQNEGLAASEHGVTAARLEAESARDRRLPELQLSARAVRTDEPMVAFATRLDQGRIAAEDFDPARLNDPRAIGGYQVGATITQVIYGGGRITAGRRAAEANADAGRLDHAMRRQQLAVQVVEAYFGSQAARLGVQYAEDVLAHARETERFVRARAADGAALASEVGRATAFRAQAEAQLAGARQQLSTARSALALLSGPGALDAELATPLEVPGAGTTPGPYDTDLAARPDLAAARARTEAAGAAVGVARGSLLPEVFAQASAEAARSADLADGTGWTTLLLGVRWKLGAADARALSAAQAREESAAAMARWQERQAAREVEEARRAIESADARVRSAEEALSASESARSIREARHRQGLLPLTEVLDAEAGLAGARALLVRSRFEARVARAQLQLATGNPVEGVTP